MPKLVLSVNGLRVGPVENCTIVEPPPVTYPDPVTGAKSYVRVPEAPRELQLTLTPEILKTLQEDVPGIEPVTQAQLREQSAKLHRVWDALSILEQTNELDEWQAVEMVTYLQPVLTDLSNVSPGEAFCWNDGIWVFVERVPTGRVGSTVKNIATIYEAGVEGVHGNKCQTSLMTRVRPCRYSIFRAVEKRIESIRARENDDIPF